MLFPRFKFLVVAFVALLQCFAPLIHAHAHAHGVPGDHHVHIHASELDALAPAPSATPEATVPDSTSTAIGVSQEFKRDFILLPVLGLIVVAFLLAAVVSRRIPSPHRHCAVKRTLPHSRPPATAPPVWAA
jgi:small neutral amino acid transporter SnatA (MarC family)